MFTNFTSLSRKIETNPSLEIKRKNQRQKTFFNRSKHFLLLLFFTSILLGETLAETPSRPNPFPGKIETANNTTVAENDINQAIINTEVKGFVLANDRDAEGDALTVQSATHLDASGTPQPLTLGLATQIFDESGNPAGTINLLADGSYTFIPTTEYTGTVPVTYVVADDNINMATNSAILKIKVLQNPLSSGWNNDVIAHDDTNLVESGETVTTFLFWNDKDIDGNELILTSATVSNGAGGVHELTQTQGSQNFYDANNVLAGIGSFGVGDELVFQAANTYVGEVQVYYTVSDGKGSTAEAIATIIVEPYDAVDSDTYASDDANVGLQGVTLTGNVQGNDYDPEGVDQDISLIDLDGNGIPETQPIIGVIMNVTVNGIIVGTFTMDSKVGYYEWTPEPNFLGTITMAYIATDGSMNNIATLYLTTLPLNSTNTKDDFNNTPYNSPVIGDVSTNDIDKEGNERSFTLEGLNGGMDSSEGTVTMITNGSYKFYPATDFIGTAKFTYTACDNGYPVRCTNGFVYIDVLPAVDIKIQPIVANIDANTTEKNQITKGNALSNDVDFEGRMIEVTTLLSGNVISGIDEKGETVAVAGKMFLNADGSYIFLSIGDFVGRIEQPYTVCTIEAANTVCDNSTLIFTVTKDEGNSTFANDDAIITDMGIAVSGNLLSNDEDLESNAHAITSFYHDAAGNGKAETEGLIGTDVIVAGYDKVGIHEPNAGIFNLAYNGAYTFTPAAGFSGNAVLPYTICDNGSESACAKASLVITVLEVNRDCGDGPTVYSAAWHRALIDNNGDNVLDGGNNVWLGARTNFETTDISSPDASTDSFDDAITFGGLNGQFPEMVGPSTDRNVDLTLNSSAAALVYYGMWIDWDNNGSYEDFINGSANVNGETTINIVVTAPDYVAAIVNIRLRADDDEFLAADFSGARTNGEVEDYQNEIALPVELIFFEGSNDECTNELMWATATEKNNSHFIVEHSADGENFEEIGRVEGYGNSAEVIDYEFIDSEVSRINNYYRLKQVDFDGAFEYSDMIFIKSDCGELGLKKAKIYPNPTNGLVNTEITNESEEAKEIELRVTDALGRTLISRNLMIQSGVNIEEIDLTEYTKGIYMISLIKNGNKVDSYPVSLLKD